MSDHEQYDIAHSKHDTHAIQAQMHRTVERFAAAAHSICAHAAWRVEVTQAPEYLHEQLTALTAEGWDPASASDAQHVRLLATKMAFYQEEERLMEHQWTPIDEIAWQQIEHHATTQTRPSLSSEEVRDLIADAKQRLTARRLEMALEQTHEPRLHQREYEQNREAGWER